MSETAASTFSSNGVGSIEIAKCAIFSTNCVISCDARAFFCEGAAQRITKQNGVVNYLRRRLIISISVIIASSEFEGEPL